MKFNKIFLAILVLIVVSGIGVTVAAEANVGDHTFTIPDGFKLMNSTDDTAILQQGDEQAIVVMMSDKVKSVDDSKKNLESQGYEFLGSQKYNADGKDVEQQNYGTDKWTIMAYVFDVGSEKCIVTYTIPANETPAEGSDNPVTTILNSIE
ncbi:MAG: hypothetical protein U0L42_11025 [Methanobrevibacter sp.]|uniref:hypothetical protein n=1 Tax=Methanobrevibacter sp. TaxID=66852 RepID=UPI002E7A09DF|nr:hypothetical protein [Methanobrevibacter sp.]MEE0936185.1 hypothetical protein [Methanobrevibacter sp.]